MHRRLHTKRRGFAIALAMLAIVILSAAGLGLLSLGQQSRIRARRNTSDIAAKRAADAGLTKALVLMNQALNAKQVEISNLPKTTSETLSNCDAIFSYTVTKDAETDTYVIESTGKYGRNTRTINATLRLKSPFESAILVQNAMVLKQGAVIDGYNFDAGDSPLAIGTTSTVSGAITLGMDVTINGDVAVGVGAEPASVINDQGAEITGRTYALVEEQELPAVIVPEWLDSLTSKGSINGAQTINDSAKYDSIYIGTGDIITINGPISLYVSGDIGLSNSAQLQIANLQNASLTLYLGGNFYCKNGGIINNLTQDPKKLKIYGLDGCSNIAFGTAGSFYGAIYAPNAEVNSKASVEMFGSVVANHFNQSSAGNFHYDASLRDLTVNDDLVHFVIKRWQEW